MIDIKFLRENPEVVKENIRKKFQDEKLSLVDEVIALDAESRKAKQEADDLRASRNRISKEIGALMGQGKKEEAEQLKNQVNADAEKLEQLSEKEKELDIQDGWMYFVYGWTQVMADVFHCELLGEKLQKLSEIAREVQSRK